MAGSNVGVIPVLCVALAFGAMAWGQEPAASEDPPPFPEFSAHRVTAPPPGFTGPRITVQIGLSASETPEPQPQGASLPDVGSGGSDWFWDAVPPGRDEGAGRYQTAMRLLASAPEVGELPVMRTEALAALASVYGTRLLQATVGTRVSPALVLSVMAVESRGDLRANSAAGAQGLMQLIPETAERFGVEDVFDADQNIAGGIAYLDWLLDSFDGDPILALAGYNAGEGAVRNAGGVPDIAETRSYVPLVLATWTVARLLCLTPPDLVSDGCVFRSMVPLDR